MAYVLAKLHTDTLLAARRAGLQSVETSLDLNQTRAHLTLSELGVALPDGSELPWEAIETISRKADNCYEVSDLSVQPIHRFSSRYNRSYTLRGTAGAPTMLISGIPMHRIKGITPDADTERKIDAIRRIGGRVLDTATGLGYTAIGAAAAGAQVTTIELDSEVIALARQNPWSRALFDNPRIEQRVGSSFEIVKTMPSESFDTVIHDPPTFSLAGELYSGEFYMHVCRLLRRGGIFFHYIGDLESRSVQTVAKGAVRRMQEAGFTKVERRPDAFAVITTKPDRR